MFPVRALIIFLAFFYRKIHGLTSEFNGKSYAKTDIAWITKRWLRYRFFEWNLLWNSPVWQWLFLEPHEFHEKKTSTPSAREWKRKKAISESTVNSQRIGITLKLEAIKKKTSSVEGQRRLLVMYFIPLYLWKRDHSRTSNKIRSNT